MPGRRAPLALLVAAALAAGCSGDDASSEPSAEDRRAIVAAVGRLGGPEAQLCRTAFTPRLVDAIWGAREQCLAKASSGDNGDPRPRVGGVRVDGDRATARARTEVSDRPIAGEVALARQDGRWRIDALGLDFLRSVLREGLAAGYVRGAEKAGERVDERSLRGCLERELAALPGARQRAIGYALLGERREVARGPAQEAVIACVTETPVLRALQRRLFERGIRTDEDIPAGARECVVRRLRQTASTKLIVRESFRRVRNPGTPVGSQLRGLALRAVRDCVGGRPS